MRKLDGIQTALRVGLFLLAASFTAILGCGSGKFFIPVCQANNDCGSSGGGTYSSYAYIANATLGTLTLFPLPTAAFTSLSGTSYALGAAPTAIAATPKGNFLYVATISGVFLYTIGTNGVPTLGNSASPVVSALFPTWMTVDPSGNWLFLVANSSNQLQIFQINTSTGTLIQNSQSPILLNAGSPTQVYVTPNDQAVYVGLGSGGVDIFAFNDSSGALTNHAHLAPATSNGAADNALGGDNNSAFLFVGETGNGVRVLKINAGGGLTEVSGSPFASPLGPSSIVVDSTNSYVYVSSSTTNVITGYTLASSGALAPLPSSPFTTGSQPRMMALDSTKKYLLVICQGGNPDLQVFNFDTTTGGKLDSVATAATGTDPAGAYSLAVVP